MINRIAEFLKMRDESVLPHEADDEERRGSARAILELMREPTEEMLEAAEGIVVGWDDFSTGDSNIYLGIPGYPQKATAVWQQLVDEALKEEPKP